MGQYIPLSLESLGEIDDGSVGLIVRNALTTIARDCMNRPTDKAKRKVIIELTMVPVANGPDLKHIEFLPEVKTKTPSYHTAPMVIRATNAGFTYSPDEVENADAD